MSTVGVLTGCCQACVRKRRDADRSLNGAAGFTVLHRRQTAAKRNRASNGIRQSDPTRSTKMHKTLALSLLLATGLAAASAVAAPAPAPAPAPEASHGSHHHHRHHRDAMGFGELRQLDLGDAQRDQIRQIIHDGFSAGNTAREALRQQRDALAALAPDAPGYQQAVNNLAEAEGEAAHDRVVARAQLVSRIYAILDPAQRQQLATLRAERRQHHAEFRRRHAPDTAVDAGS
jgi:Spy/CpxP family protein refolding chaperone